jgi:hypothetical protein
LEMFDRQISTVMATGGHPWKHLAAAGAVFVYIHWVCGRRPIIPVEANEAGLFSVPGAGAGLVGKRP